MQIVRSNSVIDCVAVLPMRAFEADIVSLRCDGSLPLAIAKNGWFLILSALIRGRVMLGLLLDSAALMFVLYLVMQDHLPDFWQIVLLSLGMAVANFVIAIALFSLIGWFVIVPIVLVNGLILMFFCHLTIPQAAMTVGGLVVYQLMKHWLFSMLT